MISIGLEMIQYKNVVKSTKSISGDADKQSISAELGGPVHEDPNAEFASNYLPIAPYNSVLVRLLQAANGALDGDPPSARDCLARAMALLGLDTDSDDRMEDITRRTDRAWNARGGLTPWQIKNLAEYVDANLSSSLRGADLAQVAKLSGSYFARAFKESFGETPHNYVMRRRVHSAKMMMRNTDQPLSHIAIACGFADQAHFCRYFLRSTGQRPMSWRLARRSVQPR
jgi:AraC-like DNA-binding protein